MGMELVKVKENTKPGSWLLVVQHQEQGDQVEGVRKNAETMPVLLQEKTQERVVENTEFGSFLLEKQF